MNLAKKTALILEVKNQRLVLAESCTGGHLAGILTAIPGISKRFCGSQVSYREDSKSKWLGVSPQTLRKHSAVSGAVAEAMVRGVLKNTPEATIAASITGYLGPTGKKVGLVYISILKRGSRNCVTVKIQIKPSGKLPPFQSRLKNRAQAAKAVLLLLNSVLESDSQS